MTTRNLLQDARGMVSAGALCVLAVLVLIVLAAAQFMRGGSSIAAEYEREMQLRLAAESGIETAAAALERDASAFGVLPPAGERSPSRVDGGPMSADIRLSVYIEMPQDGLGIDALHLVAAAEETGMPRIPDGEDWKRAKIVRARMERKGNRYVWRRWF